MSLAKAQSALGIYVTLVFAIMQDVILVFVQGWVAISPKEKIDYATFMKIIVTKVSNVWIKMMDVTMA